MYEETKFAVRKAFEIGRILFSMGTDKYRELLNITLKIKPPTIKELEVYTEGGMTIEDATIEILRERYVSAALESGFTERQGLAMLEYAAMEEEMNND